MARIRKPGKSRYYSGRFYNSKKNPTEKTVPLGTRDFRAASKRMNELFSLVDRGIFDPWAYERLPWETRSITLSQAAEQFLCAKAKSCQPKTLDTYRCNLRGLLRQTQRSLPLESLRAAHVEAYVLAQGIPDATRRHRLRHLRVFVKWANATGLVRDGFDPLRSITLPKPDKKIPAFFTPEDLDRLLAAIDAWTDLQARENRIRAGENVWLKEVILLAADTGLRLGELQAARWSWVSPDLRTLTVRHTESFRTKTGSERVVPLVGRALETVQRLKAEREERGEHLDGPLLPGPKGNGIHAKRTSRRIKFFVRKARLPEDLHFHSLRHSFGTRLALSGVPEVVIAEALGTSTATTKVYTHAAASDVRHGMEKAFRLMMPVEELNLPDISTN